MKSEEQLTTVEIMTSKVMRRSDAMVLFELLLLLLSIILFVVVLAIKAYMYKMV